MHQLGVCPTSGVWRMVSDLCLHVTKPLSKELITFPFSEFSNGYEQVRDLLEFPTFEQTCARWYIYHLLLLTLTLQCLFFILFIQYIIYHSHTCFKIPFM